MSYDLTEIKDNDLFFLETLQWKANIADKIIAQAESQGKDTNDINVMKMLGEEINAKYTPIHRSESVMTAVFVSFQLIAYYGIVVGIWGLVFNKSFLMFGLYGVFVGLLLSLLFSPVVAFQRTRERIRTIVNGIGIVWISPGILIGVVGLVAWLIRLLF
ncbi:MAG: hypothetical protein ABFD91_08540 [Anaerohalosphaeraceae bacterium]